MPPPPPPLLPPTTPKPQVLNGCGHGMPVDLWALGVLIYELLVGQTPFKSPSVDEMYERIAAGDYAFPAPPAPRTPRSRRAATPTTTTAAAAAAAEGFAKSSCSSSSKASLPGVAACGVGGASGKKATAVPEGVATRAGSKHSCCCSSSSSSSSAQEEAREQQQPAQLEKLGQQKQKQQPRTKSSNSSAVTHHSATKDSSKYATAPPASTSHRNKAASSGAHDPAAQSLVKALLCLSPGRRPSIAEVKRHPFFAGVDFDGLRAAVRAQADREEEEAVVAAAIDGDGEVWVRGQPVECISEDVEDNYGGVFAGF